MPNRTRLTWLLLGYAALRVFSYFFGPATPLFVAHPLNTAVTGVIVALVTLLLLKNDRRGWFIIAGEIILGGGGNYLEAFNLSIRTWLLLASLAVFFGKLLYNHRIKSLWTSEKLAIITITLLYIAIAWGSLNGLLQDHNYKLIINDALPYLFILYYFPLRQLWTDELKSFIFDLIVAAIIGNFLLIIFTFVGFSSHLFILQDNYYHWFRDIAHGKITELGFFYRLVINEHLLLIPLLIYFAAAIIKKEHARLFTGLALLLLILLSINLTRIYLVALAISFCFLFTKKYWRRWLAVGPGGAVIFIISFTSIHLTASRGASLGWELFGIRLSSIVAPSTENSSLSRLLLLPKIITKIQMNPFLGWGLGETITVYSPVFKKEVTTPHFDWGYLEILTELGIIGFFAWYKLLQLVNKRIKAAPRPSWQLASLIALLVINITSPALFHVFGIIWLTILLYHKPTQSVVTSTDVFSK